MKLTWPPFPAPVRLRADGGVPCENTVRPAPVGARWPGRAPDSGPGRAPRIAGGPGRGRNILSEIAGQPGNIGVMSDPEVLIRARGLTKSFGDFVAVDGIDFDLRRGEAFGFLGPNGAGKSSTMRMIGCVSPPTGGELSILGLDPVADGPAIRARLGVVPQEDTLDVELTVRENLLIYGRYFGLPRSVISERTDRLLEFVQLSDRGADQVEPLSGGLKRRLTIARSLISEPEILLLDEPTTGLDPQARHVVWDRLFRLKQQGVTLVLTTHYMDEAEQLCDRLVVMDRGKIAAAGSPRELIAQYSTAEVLELRFDPGEHEQAAEKLADLRAQRIEVLADRILLYIPNGDIALTAVRDLGLEPLTSLVRRSTLEDVFLRLTGRRLED
jgi:lipooligosaccharide transport system ATP-binding protein